LMSGVENALAGGCNGFRVDRGDHLADGVDDQIGLVEVDPVGAGGGDHLLHIVANAVEARFGERR